MMLRAAAEVTRGKRELSSATGTESFVELIGGGLVLGVNRGKGENKDGGQGGGGDAAKEAESGGAGGGGSRGRGRGGDDAGVVNGKGDGSEEEKDAAEGSKRVRRGGGDDGNDRAVAKFVETETEMGEDPAKSFPVATAEEEEGVSARAQQGPREGVVCTAMADDGTLAGDGIRGCNGTGGCGDGGDGGGDGDEGMKEMRYLCGRLFDLAAVEEGAFRRVLSYL